MPKLNVLIADDDKVARMFLRDVMVKVFSFHAEEAVTVEEAARKTSAGGCNLVLVDRHLGEGTLDDYCRLIAGDAKAAAVPKLVISGEKPLEWDEGGMARIGIRGYLVKPCRIEELKAALKRLFPEEIA